MDPEANDSSIGAEFRFLFVSTGSLGDVHPMLALALALQERGHQVRFITDTHHASLVERYGLHVTALPSPPSRSKPDPKRRWARLLWERVSHNWIYQGFLRWDGRRRWMLQPMRQLYQLIEREFLPGKTILVARVNSFGARIAHDKLGVPLVSVHLQPVIFRSAYDAPGLPWPDIDHPFMRYVRRLYWFAIDAYTDMIITPGTNKFRRELGLRPVRRPFRRWIHSPQLVVGMFPDWFGPPQPDWPPNVHLAGFPLFDDPGGRAAPLELESFLAAGPPPVVFTRGSQSRDARTYFETSVEICKRLGCRGILLARDDRTIPESLPPGVRFFGYVPFGAVLPRAAVVVHHGGIGTTALALAAGIPQIVVPLFDDQPDNAGRVQRLGAGLKVTPKAYRPGKVAPQLKRLLESDETARTCRTLAERIHKRDAPADFCSVVGEFAARVVSRPG